jgi:hypothetical protein
VPECPFEAIFPEEDVPSAYEFDGNKERMDHSSKVRSTPAAGTVIDLTEDIQPNYDFYSAGPGYEALKM